MNGMNGREGGRKEGRKDGRNEPVSQSVSPHIGQLRALVYHRVHEATKRFVRVALVADVVAKRVLLKQFHEGLYRLNRLREVA